MDTAINATLGHVSLKPMLEIKYASRLSVMWTALIVAVLLC